MAAVVLALAVLQEPDLEAAIASLNSEDPTVRDQAQAELDVAVRTSCERVRATLERHVDHPSQEVRARIAHLVAYLDTVAACREKLALFYRLNLPDVAGKSLVCFNPGSYSIWGDEDLRFHYRLGWVVRQEDDRVTLLETSLTTQTYSMDVPLPDRWDEFKDRHPADRPLPGKFLEIGLAEVARRRLQPKPRNDFGDFEHFRGGGLPHSVEPALYAYWALQRGESDLAIELLTLAEKAETDGKPFGQVLLASVAGNLRYRSIVGASEGADREDVLSLWNLLADLPDNERTAEARTMQAHYVELLKEDVAWEEPVDVTALPRQEQAAVWTHRLRDLAAVQMSQPGDCLVVGPWSGVGDDVVNPADRLVELGWDALPAVIERLDDMRPTRSLRFWRDFAPDSYVLLTHGDCCEQIFEAITGVSLYSAWSTSGTMSGDGKSALAKEAAQAWWEQDGALGAEAYHLRRLQTDDAAKSAERLLRIDAAKHLPVLIERMMSAARPTRNEMMWELAPHLAREHRSVLASFLGDEDLGVVTRAADFLWEKCEDPGGAQVVLQRLREAAGDPEADAAFESPFELLARVRSDEMVEGMIEFCESGNRRLRTSAVSSARSFIDPRIGDALVRQFRDTTPTGWAGNYEIRFCDLAAESLIRLSGCAARRLGASEEERDAQITELQTWWTANRDLIDWEKRRSE